MQLLGRCSKERARAFQPLSGRIPQRRRPFGIFSMPQNGAHSGFGKGEKLNSRLALCNVDAMNDYSEQERYSSLLGDAISPGAGRSDGSARSLSNKKI